MVETKRADRKQTKWPPRGHNGEINVHNFTGIEMDYLYWCIYFSGTSDTVRLSEIILEVV